MRTALTAIALVFVSALAALTVYVLVLEGPDLLTVISVLVVGVMAFGIFGALTER